MEMTVFPQLASNLTEDFQQEDSLENTCNITRLYTCLSIASRQDAVSPNQLIPRQMKISRQPCNSRDNQVILMQSMNSLQIKILNLKLSLRSKAVPFITRRKTSCL